ncbi:MBL fold metallo-hydrolase [Pseudarthrobacter phenanthrenivorans]|uniref:Metal-dependent hydrolase, beta-lactamase superfamily III n=1 Tax=Pseudarthrobacter phenanthrenivorans (strain DSM 18606 / JCM 16027 / LMG 23796 / Sphe3) TaxID=930171 RepID=F0MAI4_PSEPM|nr:MBL fold metallo-hydrolase [Pseudarthrobacter phenanthrenivorans]ADX72852.1 metal-dependent hydrolase, beta-lactamase superfamily III [Pseudarthrobacter phenanthrenivorans Sphe3]TPV53493.1 MBL fold metallo-hydrolase [Pseudarthrobacter phenanthrenivorans]
MTKQRQGPDNVSDRIVMLGVNGGPVVGPDEAKPALALVVNDAVYLVDCGLDASRQLVNAGLGFAGIRNVFITHHHLDHTSGLPGLLLHGWAARPPLPAVNIWGPPGTKKKATNLLAGFADEIALFESGGGFGAFTAPDGHDVEVPLDGSITPVMEDDNVRVDATRVFHGPEVANAYAYRFTVKSTGKVAVFSGDTAAHDANLAAIARGCDVLIHETQDNSAIERIAAGLPHSRGEELKKHLFEAHSSVLDLPAVALAAQAKKLVFSHYTPVAQPAAIWLAMAAPVAEAIGYTGEIIAPQALDVIPL